MHSAKAKTANKQIFAIHNIFKRHCLRVQNLVTVENENSVQIFFLSPYLFLVFSCEKETQMKAIRNELLQTPAEFLQSYFLISM